MAVTKKEGATFRSQFVLMNNSNVPLVCWQSNSLAVLSEERDSPLHSAPIVMHQPLPIVADILFSVLSAAKRAHRGIFKSCSGSAQWLSWTLRAHPGLWHLFVPSVQLVITLTTPQMDPTQHPPARYTPIQHHHTCNGKEATFNSLTQTWTANVCRTALTASVSSSCLSTSWRNISSDVTENSNMSAKPSVIYLCFYSYVALRTPLSVVDCVQAFLQAQDCGFPPTDRNRIPSEMIVCVLFTNCKPGRPAQRNLITTWRDSNPGKKNLEKCITRWTLALKQCSVYCIM